MNITKLVISLYLSLLCTIPAHATSSEKALIITQQPVTSEQSSITTQTPIGPVTFLFAHGLWGNKKNAEWYAPSKKSPWHLFTSHYYSFNFPDVAGGKGEMKHDRVNIGQHRDIEAFTNAYVKILRDQEYQQKQEGIVPVGVSRGAMTILSAAAVQSLPRLKAIVAEAPADSVITMLNELLKSYHLNWNWLVESTDFIISKLMYTDYDQQGISPLTVIDQINKTTPILLVHSKSDGFVSVNCSRALYYKLIKSGHRDAHLLELNYGTHSKYNLGADARIYQTVVHAFYKKYGIPHDPKLAKEGEKILNQCQPSLEEVAQRLRQN